MKRNAAKTSVGETRGMFEPADVQDASDVEYIMTRPRKMTVKFDDSPEMDSESEDDVYNPTIAGDMIREEDDDEFMEADEEEEPVQYGR
jgi:hypothetical protein